MVVGTVACDPGHYVDVVNDTSSDIRMYWDGRGGNVIEANSKAQVPVFTGHPRVKETKKHVFEARDENANVIYRVELTEGQLERQNWTIVVTKGSTP